MEHRLTDPLQPGSRRRVLVTGAGGQLGRALAEAFAGDDVTALSHAEWDVTRPAPPLDEAPDLVLHAAAWTNVDGAEDDPQGASAVNVGGTRNAAALGAPLVYFSTDYVFDGAKGAPYFESDGANPLSAYGRSKYHGEGAVGAQGWIVRSSWLFAGWGTNFLRTMLRLGEERDEVAVVDDQRGSPTYVGHLAEATRELVELPSRHLAPRGRRRLHVGGLRRGDLRGGRPRHACAADLDRRARAPRAAARVLRPAQREARRARLPHWREGLRDALRRVG